MADRLPDVWTTRDRPVLVEVVRRLDEQDDSVPVEEVADATGLSPDEVSRAARNLLRADLVEVEFLFSGDAEFTGVSAEALRIAGLWPDAGDAFDRLLWSLEERIAEAPPEEKTKLAKVRDAIVGVGRDIGVEVIGAAVSGRIPM
ncbi:hypothetical protein [Modestobacter sp. SYSU DS0875]